MVVRHLVDARNADRTDGGLFVGRGVLLQGDHSLFADGFQDGALQCELKKHVKLSNWYTIYAT